MSLIGKPIEEVIETLYNSINDKRQIINNMKTEFNINNDSIDELKINRLKLFDLLDEFEVTISQSLQAIQTLKVEIFNIKDKKAKEEKSNLAKEFKMEYKTNENKNYNNNKFDKLEYNNVENFFIAQNNFQKYKNKNSGVTKKYNFPYANKNNDNEIINNNYTKEKNILTEAKLNFDYSNLLNSSEISLKNSQSKLNKNKIESIHKLENNKNNDKMNYRSNRENKNDLLYIEEKNLNNNNIKNEINLNNEKYKVPIKKLNDNKINKLIINDISNIKLKEEEIEEEMPSKLNINITPLSLDVFNKENISGNYILRPDISYFTDNNIMKYNNKLKSSRVIEANNKFNDKTFNNKYNNISNYNSNFDDLLRLANSVEINQINNFDKKINKSNDDINYKKDFVIKNKRVNSINYNRNNDYLLNDDINKDIQYNLEESDAISLASKKEILIEKLKKIEEEEKFNKLIEEIFNVKSFKLYILDKFGNGRFDIFLKRYKNGEINKKKLESEKNILKEISFKKNKINNNKKNIYNNKKIINKNNNMKNTMINKNNLNSFNNINKYSDENNYYKEIKYKKIIYDKKENIKNNDKIKKKNKEIYNEEINIKKTLREGNRTGNYIHYTTFTNQNKNINSHSVNSIRARLKFKKF